jgi:chromosomal replication initiator protein
MGQEKDGLWQAVLGEIELSVSRGSYVTWFKNTTLLENQDNELVVGVGTVFIKNQLERKFNQLIVDTLKKNGVEPKKIEYKIHSTGSSLHNRSKEEVIMVAPSSSPKRKNPSHSGTANSGVRHSYRQGLNERYTFENFIVGSGNELAYAACQAIASSPGKKYNPLFLYGGVGIGKTHLIQAVGNAVLANNPDAHVVYISSEQFVQEFLDAIRYKKNTDFAGFYRGADVLIVDDMQFIAGKEKTQEEFFHTFNALHQANKQIIISSDKPPKDIPTLEERLRSRFNWGMSIDMQIPDFETRCAIVQTKATSHGVQLEPEVVDFLANRTQTNIRELEGSLNQLLAYCEMRGLNPDLHIATNLLGSGKSRPKHLTPKSIIEKTAKHFKISLEDITGSKRDKDIVTPRQIAMYIMRDELHLSYPKIAKELGRKDHTTAIHSVEKITKESTEDPDLRTAIASIKERLYA